MIERRNSQNFVTDSYTYNKRDQLTKWTTRISSIGASYEYDRVGNLIKMKSGSGTPEIDYEYDALNRLVEMRDASGVTQFAYTADGRLKTEDGPWSNDTVEWGYENGYRKSLTIGGSQNSQNAWQQDYAYDASGRLATIENPVGSFDYAYLPGSAKRQWQELSYPSGSRVRRQFDTLGRQTLTELRTSSGSVLNAHAYSYDAADRRTRQTLTHGNYWQYTYDGLGQLTSAKGYEANQTARIHEQLNYTYRSSGMRGNLNTRTRNGRTTGFIYLNTDNALYQASVREPAYVTVSGLTAPPATSVTVNGNQATVYQDGSYARADEDLARDGANQRIDIVATGPDGERRRKRLDYDTPLPAANVYQSNRINFRLDAAGNMTQVGNNSTPGTRYYQYDGYRQLTHVYEADRWRTEYVYDGLNRQRVRKRFRNEGGNWVLSEERRYLYDGRQVIQERDENNLPLVTYTRGLDLSESLDGAGGIGGLLAYTEHQTDQLRTAYYHADANGNVTAMINRHDRLVAQYQYDPFGNLLAHIGPLSEANPYRFSSKQVQPDSGLYAYGLRFYDPSLQRWINQDPLAEGGGINLYAFNYNDPINNVDPDGELPILIPIIIGIGAGTVWANAPGSEHEALNPPKGAPPLADFSYDFLPAPPVLITLKHVRRVNKLDCVSPITTRVTSWADEGIVPDLNPGRWVVKGGPSKWNYWKTGLAGPKVSFQNKYPFFKVKKSKADFSNFKTDELPSTSLKLPPGAEIIKAPLGQRVIKKIK